MFDIGAPELLLIVIVAILVIGPKEMPRALRTAGQWIGKIRRVSGHFRSGIDAMIREAEMEEMEKEWKERNQRIMSNSESAKDAEPQMEPLPKQSAPNPEPDAAVSAESRVAPPPPAPSEPDAKSAGDASPARDEPQLPFDAAKGKG